MDARETARLKAAEEGMTEVVRNFQAGDPIATLPPVLDFSAFALLRSIGNLLKHDMQGGGRVKKEELVRMSKI